MKIKKNQKLKIQKISNKIQFQTPEIVLINVVAIIVKLFKFIILIIDFFPFFYTNEMIYYLNI